MLVGVSLLEYAPLLGDTETAGFRSVGRGISTCCDTGFDPNRDPAHTGREWAATKHWAQVCV